MPLVTQMETTIKKWDSMKQKIFHIAKETMTRIKIQSLDWGKICVDYSHNKGMIVYCMYTIR